MTRARTRLLRFVLLLGAPLLVAIGGLLVWQHGGRVISTENAYVKADIAQIAPEVSGRVIEVAIRDHATIATGMTMLRIDPEPYRLALAKADAELDLARTLVEIARATWHETKSELGEVENQSAYLAKQLQRQKSLAATGVVSATKLEEAQNQAAVANDRLIVVQRRMQRVLTTLNGDPDMPVDLHPTVRDKMADRDRAALDLAHTELVAPLGGVAVNVKVQLGEQVKAGTPIFVIVANHRPWVEANLKETTLTHVQIGQKVKVVLDIYPDETWDGVVDTISPATGSEFAILPPQNASGNWVKVVQRLPVKIRLLPHDGESVLRAGMTATVDIDTGRERHIGQAIGSLFFDRASAKAAGRP